MAIGGTVKVKVKAKLPRPQWQMPMQSCEMNVSSQARGLGIGRALVEAVIDEAILGRCFFGCKLQLAEL